MTDFDNGYRPDHVYRLHFNHADPGDEGRPFARQDVVVTNVEADHLEGYKATAYDNRNPIGKHPENTDGNDVRIHDKPVAIRKSAIVMRRDFGKVGDDVRVSKDRRSDGDEDSDSDVDRKRMVRRSMQRPTDDDTDG